MPFVFKAEDVVKGTRINDYYRDYSGCSNLKQNAIKDIQNYKLNNLVQHLWNNVIWYRSLLEKEGYNPNEKFTINNLKSLPVLSRGDIQKHSELMLNPNYSGKIFKGSSSGTTGIPIKYFQDINSVSSGIASSYFLMGLSGWTPKMRSVHIWGNMESVKQWKNFSSIVKQKMYSRKKIPSSLFNCPDEIERAVLTIVKFKPDYIDGYANSIYELASFLKKHDIRIPSVKMVYSTAENMEEQNQKLIEEVIAPVSDMYGCGEINGIACRPINDSKYYIFDPHVIVETLDSNDSNMKEILVTDLNNIYMPLVRYKIGDLIDNVYSPSLSDKYPFQYFTKIYGRTADHIVLPDGKKIFPVNIFGGTLYRKYNSVTRHKTVWDGNKLVFIFEINGNIDLISLENDIKMSLNQYNISFEIKTTEKLLPSASGKFKYFERI